MTCYSFTVHNSLNTIFITNQQIFLFMYQFTTQKPITCLMQIFYEYIFRGRIKTIALNCLLMLPCLMFPSWIKYFSSKDVILSRSFCWCRIFQKRTKHCFVLIIIHAITTSPSLCLSFSRVCLSLLYTQNISHRAHPLLNRRKKKTINNNSVTIKSPFIRF